MTEDIEPTEWSSVRLGDICQIVADLVDPKRPEFAALPHDLELQIRHRKMLGESMTVLLGLTDLNDDAWKRLREVSPSSYMYKGMLPFLLIHGDKDPTVPFEQSTRFQKQMKDMGNQCDLITIPDGVHGMGGWDKLNSDYREQFVAWLKTTLKAKDDAPATATMTDLGAQVTHTDGVVTKVFFKDCSKLGCRSRPCNG